MTTLARQLFETEPEMLALRKRVSDVPDARFWAVAWERETALREKCEARAEKMIRETPKPHKPKWIGTRVSDAKLRETLSWSGREWAFEDDYGDVHDVDDPTLTDGSSFADVFEAIILQGVDVWA